MATISTDSTVTWKNGRFSLEASVADTYPDEKYWNYVFKDRKTILFRGHIKTPKDYNGEQTLRPLLQRIKNFDWGSKRGAVKAVYAGLVERGA